MFLAFSPQLKSGTYIFVAKAGLFERSHAQLQKDFQKVLFRAKTFA